LTHVFAASNTIRKIYGYVWYYNSSADVATRSLSTQIRNTLGALPTGFDTPADTDIWRGASLTLTANEEGTIFADGPRSGANDSGTLVIDDAATTPCPFPFFVNEDDLAELVLDASLGEVLDRESVYILRETWVIP